MAADFDQLKGSVPVAPDDLYVAATCSSLAWHDVKDVLLGTSVLAVGPSGGGKTQRVRCARFLGFETKAQHGDTKRPASTSPVSWQVTAAGLAPDGVAPPAVGRPCSSWPTCAAATPTPASQQVSASGSATVYRYIREAVDLLAALAPTPEQAMTAVRKKA